MAIFASDNISCVCPEVMNALVAANSGIATSYGGDEWSSGLQTEFSKIFETEVTVFPVVTGTASNALALAALARSEENTSELQSLIRNSYAGFCLKKKKHQT